MADVTASLKARLEAANQRRTTISQQIQRVMGRLEEAERTLQSVREECFAKKIDPDHMDEALGKMEAALQTAIEEYETNLSAAEAAMGPFTK